MSIKTTIQEQVQEGYEPLEIIANIATRFRFRCLRILRNCSEDEKTIRSLMTDIGAEPYIPKYISILSKNQEAAIGLYLSEQLLRIVKEIREEVKKTNRKPPF